MFHKHRIGMTDDWSIYSMKFGMYAALQRELVLFWDPLVRFPNSVHVWATSFQHQQAHLLAIGTQGPVFSVNAP